MGGQAPSLVPPLFFLPSILPCFYTPLPSTPPPSLSQALHPKGMDVWSLVILHATGQATQAAMVSDELFCYMKILLEREKERNSFPFRLHFESIKVSVSQSLTTIQAEVLMKYTWLVGYYLLHSQLWHAQTCICYSILAIIILIIRCTILIFS